MKTDQTKKIFKKYIAGNASPKEAYLVNSFLEQELSSNSWDLPAEQKETFKLRLKQCIDQQLLDQPEANNIVEPEIKPKFKFRRLWTVSAAAAVIAFFALIGLYTVKRNNDDINVRYANDVAPGGNHAILTLANGRKIDLSGSKTGELAKVNGTTVKKAANGLLVFNVKDADTKSEGKLEQFNTIETPVGGQFQVNLPDGTQVWLNSLSKLTFPSRFKNLHRTVELTGEAYFEVAKDKSHPFVVKNNLQEVEVLGTHFNINSYQNERDIKTTLLEGSVKVRSQTTERTLVPGEQAGLTVAGINIKPVDPALAIDWKNGEFRFTNESLSSILRKLSRWYGVQFKLEGDFNKMPYFSGSVSRFDQISLVLKMLEETGDIKFSISGKVVTVK